MWRKKRHKHTIPSFRHFFVIFPKIATYLKLRNVDTVFLRVWRGSIWSLFGLVEPFSIDFAAHRNWKMFDTPEMLFCLWSKINVSQLIFLPKIISNINFHFFTFQIKDLNCAFALIVFISFNEFLNGNWILPQPLLKCQWKLTDTKQLS